MNKRTSPPTVDEKPDPPPGGALKRALLYLRVSTPRQASKGDSAEGYSIPAQRDACERKALELGAVVVDEYVDAGASARSADRPALQAMLDRLRERRDVDYVIVHKLDRLIRNRADDVAIGLSIHKAGAVFVSATENIDDSPAGTLLYGIMAAIAEFYSSNLAHEAKKGLRKKAQLGGTPGYAPLGYLNTTTRIEGREVKVVVFDPERAEHIRWLFQTYATGDWSISELTAELKRRGMKSRPTVKFPGTPLIRSQVHRILGSPYYIGKVVFGGVEYDGTHEALIDRDTWDRVQDLLANRRIAGDRSWKHQHFLKGTLFCDRCDSRLGISYSTGKGGTYGYFYCLGRNKKRTNCDLPYLPVEKQEAYILKHWQSVKLAPDVTERIRQAVTEELAGRQADDRKLLDQQKRRLRRIERTRQKLIDGYLADAIPVADLKQRRQALDVEQRDAERLIELATIKYELVTRRLHTALGLLEHCGRLYTQLPTDDGRRLLNQAFYTAL